MKNTILSLILIATTALGVNVQAQTTIATTATAKVNVILNPILTVTIDNYGNTGTSSNLEETNAVNLSYKTPGDYRDGVVKIISSHLRVTSIGSGFTISATATTTSGDANLTEDSGEGTTMAGDLVTVQIGGNASKEISDLTTSQEMIVGGTPASTDAFLHEPLDVVYFAKPLTATQIGSLIKADGTAARYTTNVTYTITAQ